MSARAQRPRAALFCIALFGALLSAPIAAHAADDPLARAATHYAGQRYLEAASAYLEAVDAGSRHPALFYNLGNAYFRAGQLGRAILWYERALRAEPGLDDARYNLDVARETVAAKFGKDQVKGATAQPFWVDAVHWLPLPVLVLLALILDVVFFALLISLRFVPEGFTRTGLAVGAAFTFVAGAAAGVLLYGRVYYLESVRASIILADEVTMRELPDPQSREMPKLHAGHQVVILRESQGFARVRLANRVEGWVPKDAVEPVLLP